MDDRITGWVQEFKSESGKSVMRFIFKDESRLIEYQLEMLNNNRIPMLLKPDILKVDQEIRISYDITSLIPLKKILERKEIGRGEFFRYLRQVTGVFDQLENHLLDYGGLMLDSGMIYGSPADDRIFFVYLPIEGSKHDINESLRQFVTHLIIREMKFKNEDADNYIQRLIEILKTPDFSLNMLKSWLECFSRGQDAGQPSKAYHQSLSEPAITREHARPGPGLKPSLREKPEIAKASIRTATEKKMVYPLSSWLFLGSAAAAILALIAVMIIKGALEPGNPDMLTTVASLILISEAVIWLVCSKAIAKDKKVEKLVEKKIHETINKTPAQARGSDITGHTPLKDAPVKVEYVNKSITQPAARETRYENSYWSSAAAFQSCGVGKHRSDEGSCQSAQAACAADRTVLLAQKGDVMPSIRRLGGDGETVAIRRWPYRIGRMAGQVDYCVNNPAIGRIHAELTKGPQGYHITDMNTRNGTYINGTRIDPNMEHPIKSGDRFMLANEEFQFSG